MSTKRITSLNHENEDEQQQKNQKIEILKTLNQENEDEQQQKNQKIESLHHEHEDEPPKKKQKIEMVKKQKVVLLIGYNGKNFKGFQINIGQRTIEEELQKAIYNAGGIIPENFVKSQRYSWSKSARTDKGVSAASNIVSLKLLQHENIVEKINHSLPPDIHVYTMRKVSKSFNAHTFADQRKYEYVLPTALLHVLPEYERALSQFLEKQKASPLPLPFSETMKELFIKKEESSRMLPIEDVNKLFNIYVGSHHFHNFTINAKKYCKDYMRRVIFEFNISEPFEMEGRELVRVSIIGQSFMMHQIRKMIGMVVVMIRYGYATQGIAEAIIKGALKNPDCITPVAPSQGLFLQKCLFSHYNRRMGKQDGYGSIDFEDFDPHIETFKINFIYPDILENYQQYKKFS